MRSGAVIDALFSGKTARVIAASAASTAAAVVIISTLAHGIPLLRHDWSWPIDRAGVLAQFWDYYSGWRTAGIGSVNAYPTDYLIVLPLTAMGYVAGPLVSLVALLVAIVAVIYAGARRIAITVGVDPISQYVGAAFALLNPWVYSKIVAGHLFMVLAYGALLWLVGELWDPKPERRRGTYMQLLFVALTLQQLQFYLLAVALAIGVGVYRRRALFPLLSVALGLPLFTGLVFDRHALLQTLYLLPWQQGQSVDPAQGALLFGYFAQYTKGVMPMHVGMYVLVAVAAAGAALSFVSRRRALLVTLTFYSLGLVVASGLKWFAAPLYAQVVLALPQSGVLRELYDAIAICAYAMLIMIVIGASYSRAAHAAAWIGCAALAIGWSLYPPARFWPYSNTVPRVAVSGPAYTRFALLPAVQPLTFEGKGSGEDYESYQRGLEFTPLNEYLPSYPAINAIWQYVVRYDDRMLAELSTSRVYDRFELQSDANAFHAQRPFAGARSELRSGRVSKPLPLISVADDTPQKISGMPDLSDNAVAAPDWDLRVQAPAADRRCADPQCGWEDARLAYGDRPAMAQGFGGVFTTGHQPVPFGSPWIFAWIDGDLRQGDTVIASSTGNFRWLKVPLPTAPVVCNGACLVALAAPHRPPHQTAAAASWRKVPFKGFTPWLYTAVLPGEGKAHVLRYNVAFDPGWIAISGGTMYAHIRLDAAINGWIMPPMSTRRVWLLHWVAAVQWLFESCNVICLLAVALAHASSRWRRLVRCVR